MKQEALIKQLRDDNEILVKRNDRLTGQLNHLLTNQNIRPNITKQINKPQKTELLHGSVGASISPNNLYRNYKNDMKNQSQRSSISNSKNIESLNES